MKMKNLIIVSMAFGCYYFLHSLGTTNTITNTTNEIANTTLQPNIIQQLNYDQIIQSTSKDSILLELENQENEIWHALEKILDTTRQECNSLKQQWIKEYKKSIESFVREHANKEPLSEENYALASEMIAECGLDPQNITITSWDYPSAAGIMDTILFINEKIFNSLSITEKKFALAHEMNHIILQDHLIKFVIDKIQKTKKINSEELAHIISLLSQFTETRADTLAMLRKPKYAQAQIQFMERQLAELGDPQYKDYPTNSTRLAIGKKVLTFHHSNNTILS